MHLTKVYDFKPYAHNNTIKVFAHLYNISFMEEAHYFSFLVTSIIHDNNCIIYFIISNLYCDPPSIYLKGFKEYYNCSIYPKGILTPSIYLKGFKWYYDSSI